jgi:cell division protein FtsI (penicillin-binding protein 3)
VKRRDAKAEGRRDLLGVRRKLLLACFVLAAALVLGRAFQLQALERERWVQAAEDQQRERVPLPARRGTIYDRDGVALALSHETYRVSVAPRELRDRKAAARLLVEALGVSRARADRSTDPRRRWVVLPGRFTAEQRREVGDQRGIYFERRLERFYPQGEVGRELIGFVASDGRALGGVEQQFDGMLSGLPGYSVMRRDARGKAQSTISLPVAPPTDGADVHLTIDFDLQEIADGALREALGNTGAAGGDLLILDPNTGEILAAVSRRGGRARNLAAITEPYEPGSTLKPLVAAALLAEGRAKLGDAVDGEGGVWRDPNGRTITDSHPGGRMTLHEVLVESSNIGIVKFASRLSPGTQYEYLRDFGFGTATGIEYPAEASGRLRRPGQWSRLSAASLSMGYEISVTPLQLATAYGVLANGGVLMEPFLVSRVVGPGERVLREREPRPLRRVIPAEVASQITGVLVDVVEQGTATKAALANFAVAGKTGTARRTGAGGRYESGAYTATFASYFPAHDPQVVILVKLDRPQGTYYGGSTAAPVTRETLQGILAARSSALDAKSLLTAAPAAPSSPAPAARGAGPRVGPEGTYVFLLEEGVPQPKPRESAVAVPPLAGLPLRDAARRAHALGLHVRLQGSGAVIRTAPAAGESVAPGDTLLLVGEPG